MTQQASKKRVLVQVIYVVPFLVDYRRPAYTRAMTWFCSCPDPGLERTAEAIPIYTYSVSGPDW